MESPYSGRSGPMPPAGQVTPAVTGLWAPMLERGP